MIADHVPHGAASTDGVRAGATLRWLENSGPRYQDREFSVARLDLNEDDSTGLGDEVRLIDGHGVAVLMTPRQMSFASWNMVLDAPIGRRLLLKIRIDPVGRVPRR